MVLFGIDMDAGGLGVLDFCRDSAHFEDEFPRSSASKYFSSNHLLHFVLLLDRFVLGQCLVPLT